MFISPVAIENDVEVSGLIPILMPIPALESKEIVLNSIGLNLEWIHCEMYAK